MNKLVFAAVFLVAVCYFAQVDAVSVKPVPETVYQLTVNQVKSFVKFLENALSSIIQSLKAIKADATEFKKAFDGENWYWAQRNFYLDI